LEKSSLHITWFVTLLGCTSMLYFLSLLVHLPVVLTAVILAAIAYFLYRFFFPLAETFNWTHSGTYTKLSYILFIGGIAILVNKCFYLAEKHGEWDAWAIWNLHARYMADGMYWTRMTGASTIPHPDYPLFLPSVIGFLWRLLQSTSFVIPYIISFITALAIPALIFLQLYKRSLFIAVLMLLWFATDDFFLSRALSQFADQWVGLFFLLAFISMDAFKSTANRKFITISAFMLGCCFWTKNEGIMLAVVFTTLYCTIVLKRANVVFFLAGLALPVLCLLIFKLGYAPPNDLVLRRSTIQSSFFTDAGRHGLILQYLQNNFKENFFFHQFAIPLFLIVCIIKRTLPSRNMAIVFLCFCGFLLVYLLTPFDLQWHLHTSMQRVLFQLSPVFIYEVGKLLSSIQLRRLKKHSPSHAGTTTLY
jgi:hypothetical protein